MCTKTVDLVLETSSAEEGEAEEDAEAEASSSHSSLTMAFVRRSVFAFGVAGGGDGLTTGNRPSSNEYG